MKKLNALLIVTLISTPTLVMAIDVFESAQDLNGDWNCTTYAARNDNDTRCTPSGDLLFTKQGVLTFKGTEKTWSYAGTSPNDGFEGCRSELMSSGKYDARANRLILVGKFGTYIYPLERPNETTFSGGGQSGLPAFFVCKRK